MAATLTPNSELTYVSFPIEKTETTPDGDLLVYGKATDGSVDSDEQIVDPDFSSKAIADWLSSGANVRVQHNAQRDPAGVGIEVNSGGDGETWVKSLVIEPVAKRLVEKGALRAYSVGIARPKIVRDSVARGGRIVGGEIVEISLVDRPANKNCGIQLVKSAGDDGHAEWVGKVFGNSTLIQKAADDVKTVELPAHSTFSPADLAKLLEHRALAEKRQMDPSVGGGVDRDKIPAANFAGRDRSFPIVKPGDVSDAASSIGRAGTDNYSSDKLKENIIRIARRLGPEFVQELPESWKGESTTDTLVEKKKDKRKKKADEMSGGSSPFAGAHPTFSSEHQPPAESTKGAKDCPNCGKSFHADSKLRKCDKCGTGLPMAKGVEDSTAVKGDKIKCMCAGCGANIDADHNFCPECGNDMSAVKAANKCDCGCGPDCSCQTGCTCGCDGCMKAQKGHDFNCLGCGRELDDDEKYCPRCGKQNPGYEGMNNKAGKPTPGAGVVGEGASDVKPVPAHREPDGEAVEALEHDAGLPTDPDTAAMKSLTRIKTIGVPYDLAALHDTLCAGYHPDDVAKSHPSFKVSGMDLGYWQSAALDAATGGTLEQATKATALWQEADTLKMAGDEVINDLRIESHKAFRDANQGPATFPTPTELSPSKFNRPYISAGHADNSPGASGPNTANVPTRHMDASDYTRGYLAGGHASDSPSNKNTGIISRVEYASSIRNAAANAMRSMHDHISQTFPDLCPMVAPGLAGTPPVGARPAPMGVGKNAEPKAKKHKKAKLLKAEHAQDPVITELLKQVTSLSEQVASLSKNVDALGDLPDPRVAAFKGAGQNPVTKSAGLTGIATVAETAERTQMMMMRELESQFRASPDPAQREAAWNALVKMRGLPTT
jgi:hypothetical protein